jgi:hypothetical protein
MKHRQRPLGKVGRIELHLGILTLCRTSNREFVLGRMLCRKRIEHPGDVQRNTRAHQHITHPGQHGPVDRRQVGQLHLLKKIDPYRILVAFARQKHLDKVAHNAQLDHLAKLPPLVHRRHGIELLGQLAAGHEILLPDPLGHIRKGKRIQAPPHVPAQVSIGKPTHKKLIERGTGNHAEAAES